VATRGERVERRLSAVLAADVVGFSSLMSRDEEGTFARIKSLREVIIEPQVRDHRGRLVKTTGDGFLGEFASPVEAVRCAIAIQAEIDQAEAGRAIDNTVRLRMGINLGDIIIEDGGDVYGDGVNIAARLEALCDPGGVLISGKVYDEVEGKIDRVFEDRGTQHFKNIARPVRVYAMSKDAARAAPPALLPLLRQEIRYTRAADGVRLAWAKVGSGAPLLKAANWMNHLEYDWETPIYRPFLERLARTNTLIRYDARGNGLSDWDVAELSLDAWVSDLKAIADAAGLERFPLFGISQGCAVSVAFAVKYPERVSRLILYGGFAVGGRKRSPDSAAMREAMTTLMRLGWGADEPVFRQLFTSRFAPEATKQQADAFNELQRRTTSPECAARYYETVGDLDVRDLLEKVSAPTLVLHARGDIVAPLETGRQLASGIPGAKFVAFEGRNHILQEGEPGFERFFEELSLFLNED
jgi:class 3 adenylate cyclase/pimeloyl-ACP methyl ester carboxylesterase